MRGLFEVADAGAPRGGARLWLSSELGARIVSALVLAVVALLATYSGGWTFTLFWLAAGIVVAVEWVGMTRIEPARWIGWQLGIGLTLTTLVYLVLGLDSLGDAMILTVPVLATIVAIAATTRLAAHRRWAVGGLLYAAVIVIVPPVVRDHPELGLTGLLWMFAVVWTTDIAAFFAGRRFGGPRLWARVSPKKTWSGFFGGLSAGTVAGILVFVVASHRGWTPVASIGFVGAISALGSVVSQLGDLGESAMKRRCGVKDSGQLIPGHGGVMDRLDGFWALALLMGVILAGVSAVRG